MDSPQDQNIEIIIELYGIIVKEYLKTALDFINIAKSKDSIFIIHSGFNIITDVFKTLSINANDLETVYKKCSDAILFYLEYINQSILSDKYNRGDTINANIFIFSKIIKMEDSVRTRSESIRSRISESSRLFGFLFDWTNTKYSLIDRKSIADGFALTCVKLFANLDKSDIIVSGLQMMRDKYGSMDVVKFQIYLKELYCVLKKRPLTKDRFELYETICDEITENKYHNLFSSEDKKEFRKFFYRVFLTADALDS